MTGAELNPNIRWLVLIGILFSIPAATAPNHDLTVTGIWLPVLLAILLWRRGEVPVLLFVVLMQWIKVFTKAFNADVQGVDLYALFGGPELSQAIWLSAGGLIAFATGMRVTTIGMHPPKYQQVMREIQEFSLGALWKFFLATFALSMVAEQASGFSGQIRQIALALSSFEWVAFFVLSYAVVARRTGYIYLAAALALELVSTIGGFFADFKQPFFILFMVVVGVVQRVDLPRVLLASAIVIVTLVMGVVWSVIKIDYRDYVSGYSGAQSVVVPWGERVSYLADSVTSLDSYDFQKGVDLLVKRVAYVDFFARTLKWVPNVVPHEEGRLVGGAIKHIVTPRLLFPNKPPLESDTDRTSRYTGIEFHSAMQTSIGFGFMTEAYVDFGPVWMFVPIFALGIITGGIYRYFLRSSSPIFGYGFSIPVLLVVAQTEIGFNKILGGMLMGSIVMALVARYGLPLIYQHLLRPESSAPRDNERQSAAMV